MHVIRCPTIGAAVATTRQALETAGIDQPALDARLLVAEASGLDRLQMLSRRDQPLPEEAVERLDAKLRRRLAREPLAYIVGRKEFWSLDFAVDRDVLIPRPDSETLVETALAWVDDRQRPWRILDLGTGSGCLLLALLHELTAAWGMGVDLSVPALRLARENALRLGLDRRTAFVQGDWSDSIGGRFNLVVANPPYVSEAEWQQLAPEITGYEPPSALLAGTEGLDAYCRLFPDLRRVVDDTGAVFLEIGAEQDQRVIDIAACSGFECAGARDDLVGLTRCLQFRPTRNP